MNGKDKGDEGEVRNVDLPGDGGGMGETGSGSVGGPTVEDLVGTEGTGDEAGTTGGDDGTGGDTGDDGTGNEGTGGGDNAEAAILAQMEELKQQNAMLMEQLSKTGSDNERLEEENNSLLNLEHDDLVAMVQENPKGFVESLYNEVKENVLSEVENKNNVKETNAKIESTIEKYANEDDTFEQMWEDGSIQQFMDDNPGHNAISAHMMLTLAGKLAAAKKEGAEEAMKNFNTKLRSQTLGSGATVPPDKMSEAVKNPDKFGGKAKVAAMRAGLL